MSNNWEELMNTVRDNQKAYADWVAKRIAKADELTKPREAINIYNEVQKMVDEKVDHPDHYTTGGIETWDFIQAKGLNYNLGNVVKYVSRSEHKGNAYTDLKKAMAYLQREIDLYEK